MANISKLSVRGTTYDISHGAKSLTVGTGLTAPDYSIVSGTADKTLVTGIIGSTVAEYITTTNPTTSAQYSMSIGSSTTVNSTGGNAIGVMNTSGVKGYYYSEIAFSTKQITLSTSRSSTAWSGITLDWKVGDTISFINDSKYPACCKITAISNNVITVDSLPFASADEIVSYSDLKSAAYTPDDFTIFACYQKVEVNVSTLNITHSRWYPRSGNIELGWLATAFGAENLVTGSCSFSGGWNNWSSGDFGVTFGRDNISGYSGLVSGNGNIAPAECGFAVGKANTVKGNNAVAMGLMCTANGAASIALGNKTTTSASSSFATGIGTTAYNRAQFVCGTYNSDVSGALFQVGYGTNDKNRKTAISVLNTGAVYVSELHIGNEYDDGEGDWLDSPIVVKDQSIVFNRRVSGNLALAGGLDTNGGIAAKGLLQAKSGCSISGGGLNVNTYINNSEILDGIGNYSIAVGSGTQKASGKGSIALGNGNTVTASAAVALGKVNTVTASNSFAAGANNTVVAGANNSIVLGTNNIANTPGTILLGYGLQEAAHTAQGITLVGKYNNVEDSAYRIFVVGYGTSNDNRKNALTISSENGNAIFSSTVTANKFVGDGSSITNIRSLGTSNEQNNAEPGSLLLGVDNSSTDEGEQTILIGASNTVNYSHTGSVAIGYENNIDYQSSDFGPVQMLGSNLTTGNSADQDALNDAGVVIIGQYNKVPSNSASVIIANGSDEESHNAIVVHNDDSIELNGKVYINNIQVAPLSNHYISLYDPIDEGHSCSFSLLSHISRSLTIDDLKNHHHMLLPAEGTWGASSRVLTVNLGTVDIELTIINPSTGAIRYEYINYTSFVYDYRISDSVTYALPTE